MQPGTRKVEGKHRILGPARRQLLVVAGGSREPVQRRERIADRDGIGRGGRIIGCGAPPIRQCDTRLPDTLQRFREPDVPSEMAAADFHRAENQILDRGHRRVVREPTVQNLRRAKLARQVEIAAVGLVEPVDFGKAAADLGAERAGILVGLARCRMGSDRREKSRNAGSSWPLALAAEARLHSTCHSGLFSIRPASSGPNTATEGRSVATIKLSADPCARPH